MKNRRPTRFGQLVGLGALGTLMSLLCLTPAMASESPTAVDTFESLVDLFNEWRAFEYPGRLNGVPDYTAASMARQAKGIADFRRRLEAIDYSAWPIDQRVDWYLVWAEINGLEFYHKVLQPWARDPGFYASVRRHQSDTPAEEGPTIHDALRLWKYPVWPRTKLADLRVLTPDEDRALSDELQRIPLLLAQARTNLIGNAADLWAASVRSFDRQEQALNRLERLIAASASEDLQTALREAIESTKAFRAWIVSQLPQKTQPSGIGRDAYTWHLRNVLLVNLTWETEKAILESELARAHMSLHFEEARNREVSPLPAADSPKAFYDLQQMTITQYLQFLRDRDLITVKPYYERALRERIFDYVEPPQRDFFLHIHHMTPMPLWGHYYHYWDLEQMTIEPHRSPIRRGPLRFNVWMSRAEGVATGMEEWTLHAGLYESAPRARETVWIMLAMRAARGIASLHVHDNTFDMAAASDFHVEHTPRGWMRRDGLLGFEQQLYLQQPGYGPTYVSAARLIDNIIKTRAQQLGSSFTLRRYFDEMNDAGMIPVSVLRWQLTSDDSDIRAIVDSYAPLP